MRVCGLSSLEFNRAMKLSSSDLCLLFQFEAREQRPTSAHNTNSAAITTMTAATIHSARAIMELSE